MNPLTIRKWHGYIGMLIAPSVMFFALTGAVQLFGLHEAHGSYHPPALLESLSAVHKDQVFEQKKADPDDQPERAAAVSSAAASDKASQAAANAAPDADHDAAPGGAGVEDHEHHHMKKAPRVTVYLLKWFFLIVALGLFTSTAFGIWMGLQQRLRRRTHAILLLVGLILPVMLIVS
jgi:hypothetical protein